MSQLFQYEIDSECLSLDTLLHFTGGETKKKRLSIYPDFEYIVSSGWRRWLFRMQEADFYLPCLIRCPLNLCKMRTGC